MVLLSMIKIRFRNVFSDFAVTLKGHTALVFVDLSSIGEPELQLFS
jgi:hypothetical protein